MTLNPFDYQLPSKDQVSSIYQVRSALKLVHGILLDHVPAGRERSVAITKLEEVSMWANKGIVFEVPRALSCASDQPGTC